MTTILVPYHLDERRDGLIEEAADVTVIAELPAGDVWERIAVIYDKVADEVARADAPMVVSGDCTTVFGTVAGLQRRFRQERERTVGAQRHPEQERDQVAGPGREPGIGRQHDRADGVQRDLEQDTGAEVPAVAVDGQLAGRDEEPGPGVGGEDPAREQGAERFSVIWFDAHGDVQSLETTTSGYVGGMPLRILVGYRPELIADRLGIRALDEEDVVLVDARDLDPPEVEFLEGSRIRRYTVDNLEVPDGPLLVHLDVDVIDGAELPGLLFPVAGGPPAEAVVAKVKEILATGRVLAFDLACTWRDGSEPAARKLVHSFTKGSE